MNYKNTAFVLFLLLFHSTILGKDKQYDVYLYGSLKAFTITLEKNELSIKPINFGSFLLKDIIEYDNQIFEDNNLIIQLLSDKKIAITDTAWIKQLPLLDNVVVDVRFLFSEEEDVLFNNQKIATLLYRMDIKERGGTFDETNLVNTALIDSSLRKVWIDKNTGSIIKLSFMYKGISYIINKNEN